MSTPDVPAYAGTGDHKHAPSADPGKFIIPVIDLLDGRVVHARGGARDQYRPVRSALCDSAEPVEVLRALMRLAPFPVVYIADLGAILGRRSHDDLLLHVPAHFPGVEFWVDNGCSTPAPCPPRRVPVIGTETGIRGHELRAFTRSGTHFILSLDFDQHGFRGEPEILCRPDGWPRQVIIMDLARVGTTLGPAWPMVDDLLRRAPDRDFYIAGGVRDRQDIAEAIVRGLQGALIATALHNGTLFVDRVQQAKKTPA